MTTPTKPRWARMGGVVRRASWALAPTRSSTSSIASIERDNSDAASLKGSVRSVSSTPPTLVPPKPVASHPSPIPESPVQQNEIPQPATAVPSLVQAPGPDPEPVSSPVQEYTPPPLIDSTGVGPGGFTDDSDDLPQPQPIRDPSLLQYDSNDGHEPSASEPTAGTRSGGFDDDDQVLPQSQTIIAPSLHHTESADSSTPPVADTARVSSRGFNDGLPQPQLVEGSPVHESDDSANQVLQRAPSPVVVQPHVSTVPTTPEPIFAQPLVPTEPTTPILSEPTDNGTYFGLPIQDEPDHNRQLSPEPIEEFKAQVDDDIFAAQPGATEERNLPGVLPGMLSNGQGPGPVAVDDNEFEDAVQMPKPEPVAPVAPLVAPAYVPQFDADPGQEVWEGVAHQQEVSKGETSSRSRTASIHSMVAGELFADPMAPRITVSHHEHGAPQMPHPVRFFFKAAIVLSASVTFLSLPGLDNFARVAGFVAILFSTFSMVSTIVAIFRYKADMDHPISHVAGEGLMMLTRRSVVMALPLIFLAYAIVAFVTGIVLYSFWDVNDDLLDPKRPFEDYTKWTVIGVLGGLAGMLFTSLLLLKR
ncbi:hypothetical protein H0H87_009096 [Tephrocybe sp. NHM501043]|nr:hypothetical protein H0H87_009096 [Tephrocybe sp. NHM501043]